MKPVEKDIETAIAWLKSGDSPRSVEAFFISPRGLQPAQARNTVVEAQCKIALEVAQNLAPVASVAILESVAELVNNEPGQDVSPEVHPAMEYLTKMYERTDRLAIIRIQGKAVQQTIHSVREIAQDDFIRSLVKDNEAGFNVYHSMNALRPLATGRTKEDIGAVRTLYIEVDKNTEQILDVIRESTLVPSPSAINEEPTTRRMLFGALAMSPWKNKKPC